MDCEEFREDFHLKWQPKWFSPIPKRLKAHLRVCESCRMYVDSMYRLNTKVFVPPPLQMPARLQQSMSALATASDERVRTFAWKPYVVHAALLLLPAVVLYIAVLWLPGSIQFWLKGLISLLGMSVSLFLGSKRRSAFPTG